MLARTWIVFSLLLVGVVGVVTAQDLEPETVNIEAEDGLVIVGDMYHTGEMQKPTPAVILLHMLGSNRGAWAPLIPALTDEAYAVLAIDMRGHGETGGSRDWELAEQDMQLVFDWLRSQPDVDPDAISVAGGSIGANMALISCANDADCVTAVALSPGLDYLGVRPLPALTEGLEERSALLVASHNDNPSGGNVKTMVTDASGEVGLRLYTGRVHGTNILTSEETLIPLIVSWLNEKTVS